MNCYYNKRWHDFYYDSNDPGANNFSLLQSRINDELFRFILDCNDDSSEIAQRMIVFRESYYNAKRFNQTCLKLIMKIEQARSMKPDQAIRHLGRCLALSSRVGVDSFFGVNVQSHDRNPSLYVAHICDPYYREKETVETRAQVRKELDEVYDAMREDHLPLPKKKLYLKRMFWFVEQLSRRSLTPEESLNPDCSQSEITDDFLAHRSPFWRYYLEDYLVVGTPYITYSNLRTIDYIDLFLRKDPERILPVLIDHLIMSVYNYYQIDKPNPLKSSPETRIRYFLNLMIEFYGPYLDEVYQARHGSPEKKAVLHEMFQKMIAQICQSLRNEDLFVERTRELAIEKLQSIILIVGRQGFRYNLDAYPRMDPNDLQLNMMKINSFLTAQRIAMIGKPKSAEYIGLASSAYSFNVNAYYDPVHNAVYLPTAIYDDAFFDLSQGPAAHYGGIGSIMGHEIVHSFDNNGSKYDPNGVLANWWTETDHANYRAETAKILKQYANVQVNEMKINAELTLSENISDIIGIKVSLKTFRNSHLAHADRKLLDEEKEMIERFFKQWVVTMRDVFNPEAQKETKDTDPHAPESLRVNLPFAHLDEFYQIYHPKPSDLNYLVPSDRLKYFN